MNRLERISAILVKLQSRPVVTAREIAEHFGVSLRTVYRDIRSLEESGIPISGESGLGYSLVDGFKLPPLMFTAEEAISFLMAEKLVSYQTDGDTYDVFRSGMDKIRAVLKTTEKDLLQTFDRYIHVSYPYHSPPGIPANVLQPLLKSLRGKKQVSIDYCAGYNYQTTHRTIEPQGIFFMSGLWYVLAWCTLRGDYRTFHLGRIKMICSLEHGFIRSHPALEKLIKSLYYNQTDYEVRLRVYRDAARDTENSKYKFGLYKEIAVGDYFIQQYQTWSLEIFARWFLSFADQAEIIEPQELKDVVKELIGRIKIMMK